ncbi:Ku protein [Legionella beliardensis]|uniref:Non-homologous end joining protein Ku n=1 Tax=Legionella beliardensis TaxID=91822 RepID=A0A378I498_9GAMM|nr:Ku protein [Legionella beliardensis]STX29516.1 Ku protein [Legionella beliardensis]
MTKPVWKGYISFGLVAIPVDLYPVEKKNELRFHLLDSRDQSRVHYERINAETGKEVPWDEVVKAYEFQKGSYVVLDEEDFKRAAPEAFKSIDIEEFVNLSDVSCLYFDRPYYMVPDSSNKKAYVLLRESLKKTKKVGVAKIVIRNREHLTLILPHEDALILYVIRYQQEIRSHSEFEFPEESLKAYHINDREIKIATDLIDEMSAKWQPEKYHDEYREALMKWIEEKKPTKSTKRKAQKPTEKNDDLIDFMTLLKNSLKNKARKSSGSHSDKK